MDIEFHYYMTYLIAVRAGYSTGDAVVIAHASQGIDDNHIPIEVAGGLLSPYRNRVSQTMDIVHPCDDAQIYPFFHFVPGNPASPTAARVDGTIDPMVTTPHGDIARRMLARALAPKDLHRIGIAAHVYADTWAHQNFLGKRDPFNRLGGSPAQDALDVVLDVGHGAAEHRPDVPALIWTDRRLIDSEVNNKQRCLDAAEQLFRLFAQANAKSAAEIAAAIPSLLSDLAADIGPPARDAITKDPSRIARYQARALTAAYGGQAIPPYDVEEWFEAAMQEKHDGILDEWKGLINGAANELGDYSDLLRQETRLPCSWRDPAGHGTSQWFRFQEAVKAHFDDCHAELAAAGLA